MKLVLSVLALTGSIGAAVAACNANNCLRAVTGSNSGLAVQAAHKTDCSTLLQSTFTPSTSTIYQTISVMPTTATVTAATITSVLSLVVSTETDTSTITITQAEANAPVKRIVATSTAPSVPAYASPCSSYAAYSSACSCWGVTASTITAPTAVTTVLVTISVTPTASATAFATETDSETATMLMTVTSTAAPSCPTTLSFTNRCSCSYDVQCNQAEAADTVVVSATSLDNCAYKCDYYTDCYSFSFQESSLTCGLNPYRSATFVAGTSGWVFGLRASGSCELNTCDDP